MKKSQFTEEQIAYALANLTPAAYKAQELAKRRLALNG